MSSNKESIEESLKNIPDFLTSKDLIKLGLFNSPSNICHEAKRGCCPPRVRMGTRKVVYPKNLLIEWLSERIQ
jgi:hypothetical protein